MPMNQKNYNNLSKRPAMSKRYPQENDIIVLPHNPKLYQFEVGDVVENIYRGKDSPYRFGRFIRYVTKSYTNRYGVRHSTTYAEVLCDGGYKGRYDLSAIKAVKESEGA